MNINTTKRVPSPQQQAVVDFVANGRGSAFVEAVAGAGKTTTLCDALAGARGSVGFAAYNRKIADEIKAKTSHMNLGNRVRVGTFHSFGLNAWRYVHKDVKAGPEAAREKGDMTHAKLFGAVETAESKALRLFVPRLIGLAKQRALGLYGSIDDVSEYYRIIEHFDMMYDLEDEALAPRGVELTIAGLKYHREIADSIIDFDDMIYMPVVSGIRMWQNDMIFVDEAQDTNPARRALARKMLKPSGRAVFVGDRHQAIYGFTGADNDAVEQIIRDFSCVSLPMTTTYRCPKNVVAKAQEVVSHIQAHDSAPDGTVSSMMYDSLIAPLTEGLQPDYHFSGLLASDAVLCRKTKPLVDMAFGLIRQGVACHVEGRDIGAGLIKLIDRFKSARTLHSMLDRMRAYGEQQAQKLTAKGREAQAENLLDRVATVAAITDKCGSVDELKQRITSMFEDSENERKPTLTLSTVHKAKGREWPRVFVLGANAWMPGPWARQDWEQVQERNLMYVAYTRAQLELIFLHVTE